MNCQHQRAYTYTEAKDDGRVFIVRQCYDCHAEIVRREINEDFVKQEAQRQPALISE